MDNIEEKIDKIELLWNSKKLYIYIQNGFDIWLKISVKNLKKKMDYMYINLLLIRIF